MKGFKISACLVVLLLFNLTFSINAIGGPENTVSIPNINRTVTVLQLLLDADDSGLESTFDIGNEGWSLNNDGENLTHHVSGGNPGGFISADDQVKGLTWYFVAPPTWDGDWTSYSGGSISYDIKIISGDPDSFYPMFDIVIGTDDISSFNYVTWTSEMAPDPDTWTHYEVELSQSNFEISGEKTWEQIISNVTYFFIRGEHIGASSDTEGIDNIRVVGKPGE